MPSRWLNIILVIMLAGCAAQGPPGGGPEDKEGPVLISSVPKDMETNVTGLSEIFLEFSEPVQIKNAESRLMISPTLLTKPEVEIKGRKVVIKNIKGLQKDVTYIVSLGRSVQDLHGNFAKEDIRIAFSTGDSIDNSSILGTVYNLPKKLNCFILAYRARDSFPDSLLGSLPDYICQVGENGSYKFRNLSPGVYRLLAVCTRLSDPLKDKQLSLIGLPPFSEINVEKSGQTVDRVNFYIQEVELSPFRVVSYKIEKGILRIRFTHKLKEDSLSVASVDFVDANSVKARSTWVANGNENVLNVGLDVIGERLKGKLALRGLLDIYGKKLCDTLALDLEWKSYVDSVPPSVVDVIPRNGARDVDPDVEVRLDFSEPVVIDSGGIEILVDSASIGFEKRVLDSNTLILKLAGGENLAGREFIIRADGRRIYDLSGLTMSDTVVSYRFTTLSLAQTGSISGHLISNIEKKELLMVEAIRDDGKFKRAVRAGADGEFLIEYLLPGKYSLFVWYDKDGDCIFDGGKVFPYTPSEPFWFPENRIRVRARWETAGEEVILD